MSGLQGILFRIMSDVSVSNRRLCLQQTKTSVGSRQPAPCSLTASECEGDADASCGCARRHGQPHHHDCSRAGLHRESAMGLQNRIRQHLLYWQVESVSPSSSSRAGFRQRKRTAHIPYASTKYECHGWHAAASRHCRIGPALSCCPCPLGACGDAPWGP